MQRTVPLLFLAFCVTLHGGCAVDLLRDPILDFIGPTYAVAVPESSGVANAGQAMLLSGAGSYLLLGSGNAVAAADADTFTYSWSVTDQPGAPDPTFDNTDTSQPTFTATLPGTYTITLTVTGRRLATDPLVTGASSITIEVQ
jgi:hypothetical protein